MLVTIQTFYKYVLCNFAYVTDPDIYLFLMKKPLAGLLKFSSSSCKYVTVT